MNLTQKHLEGGWETKVYFNVYSQSRHHKMLLNAQNNILLIYSIKKVQHNLDHIIYLTVFVPFEEMNPLVSLEDHKTCSREPEEGCGACKVLRTQMNTE